VPTETIKAGTLAQARASRKGEKTVRLRLEDFPEGQIVALEAALPPAPVGETPSELTARLSEFAAREQIRPEIAGTLEALRRGLLRWDFNPAVGKTGLRFPDGGDST
jgi:hypothetical protein